MDSPQKLYMASLSPGSRHAIEGRLRWMGPVDWARVSYPWARAILARAESEGQAIATRNLLLAVIKGCAREARRIGLINRETEWEIRDIKALPEARLPTGRLVAAWELERLLAAASAWSREMKACILILAHCGLRRAEWRALAWGDVEQEDGVWGLRIRGKGAKERWVPLSEQTRTALLSYRLEAPRRDSERIFGGWDLRQRLMELCRRAVVEHFTPHDLRRTFVSAILDVAHLTTAQELAGHANPEQTRRYDRAGPRRRAEAVAKLKIGGSHGTREVSPENRAQA